MPAARRPVFGADRVARLIVVLAARYPGLGVARADLNGAAGLLSAGTTLFAALVVEIGAGRTAELYLTNNPDKLAFLTGQALRPGGAVRRRDAAMGFLFVGVGFVFIAAGLPDTQGQPSPSALPARPTTSWAIGASTASRSTSPSTVATSAS